MNKVREESGKAFILQGGDIKTLSFSDDIEILAELEDDLEEIINGMFVAMENRVQH